MGERERIDVWSCVVSKISLPDESPAMVRMKMLVSKILTAPAPLFLSDALSRWRLYFLQDSTSSKVVTAVKWAQNVFSDVSLRRRTLERRAMWMP